MDECRKRVKRALSYLSSDAGTTPRQEMQLLTALGVALYSIGPGPESRAVWTWVKGIAEDLKDTDYQLRAQWGLWTVCVTGGKHRAGLAMAQTFARLAEKGCDPEGLLVGERLVGISHHFLGEQTVALRHLEGMLNRAPVGNPADILRFQFDQSVVARAFLGKVLWLKGLPDAAMRGQPKRGGCTVDWPYVVAMLRTGAGRLPSRTPRRRFDGGRALCGSVARSLRAARIGVVGDHGSMFSGHSRLETWQTRGRPGVAPGGGKRPPRRRLRPLSHRRLRNRSLRITLDSELSGLRQVKPTLK
jgi:hypothetical protein